MTCSHGLQLWGTRRAQQRVAEYLPHSVARFLFHAVKRCTPKAQLEVRNAPSGNVDSVRLRLYRLGGRCDS